MISVTALRAEWRQLEREPVDQFWVGPGPFVDRLFGILEEQRGQIEALRAVFAPLLELPPRHGAPQVAMARKIWAETEPWAMARPR